MSKTTPVRWWRDDATRYQSRSPYVAPPYDGPVFEPIAMSPGLVADIAALQRIFALVSAVSSDAVGPRR